MKGKIIDRSDERLAALRFALRSAPPKEKRGSRLSLKATVDELLPDLIAMRHKGYTDAELAEMMSRSGFEIAAGTLKNYINKGKALQSKPKSTETAASTDIAKGIHPDAASTTPAAAPVASPARAAPAAAKTAAVPLAAASPPARPLPKAPAPRSPAKVADPSPAPVAAAPGIAHPEPRTPAEAAEIADAVARRSETLPKLPIKRRPTKKSVLGHKLNDDV